MKLKTYTILAAFLISAEVFLLGCSGFGNDISSDLIDKSVFTDLPCAAPCWYGLEIGKSSESEVMDVLTTLKFIDQGAIYIQSGGESISISSACALQPEKICAILDIENGRLSSITSYLNYKTTIIEVVKYLGNPDKVGYMRRGGPEVIECVTQFMWIERQLVLTSTPLLGTKGCEKSKAIFTTGLVDANLEIESVGYLSVDDINKLVADTGSTGNFNGVESGR